jgi:hypothetical protein
MAAIFAVHGLSTPGVLQQGDREAPAYRSAHSGKLT